MNSTEIVESLDPEFSDFLCLHPAIPLMAESDKRFQTFSRWQHPISPREMTDAGFWYLGDGDRVQCFYCSGTLRNWQANENPWFEHAKWFPLCEFVLQKQSVEYVQKICSQYRYLVRPELTNPCLSDSVKCIRDLITPNSVIVNRKNFCVIC